MAALVAAILPFALAILFGTVIITVVLDAWMLTRAPQEYASRKFLGLTIAPWVGGRQQAIGGERAASGCDDHDS